MHHHKRPNKFYTKQYEKTSQNTYFHVWEVLLAPNTGIWCGLSLDLSANSSSTWY